MNRSIISLFLVFGFMTPMILKSQNKSITFEEGRWSEILVKARNTNKLIFLDAYAAWCGPCKNMASTVFTQDEVAQFYNDQFICAKIDMEKGEGPQLAQKYGVRAYPTYLFIDGEGKLIHRSCGAMPAFSFIQAGKDALDTTRQINYFIQKYSKGERNPEFLIHYLDALFKGCMDIEPALKQYFSTIPEHELGSKVNWQLIFRFVTDIQSREFTYLLNNQAAFAKISSRDSVDQKIYSAFIRPAYKAGYSDNPEEWKVMRKRIVDSKFGRAGELIFTIDLIAAERKADWPQYLELAMSNTDMYKLNDFTFLVSTAQKFLQQATTPAQLKKAIEWAQRSAELDAKPYSRDTWARLVKKSGDTKKAIEIMEALIKDLKAANEPADSYEIMLKTWKSE